MVIIEDITNLKPQYQGTALALGNFDGVHIAHQEIIKTCINYAKNNKLLSSIMTFSPHPHQILRPNSHHKNLIPLKLKLELFNQLGIDLVFLIKFDIDFANISATSFIKDILVDQLKINHVVSGYNFFFGHNREGNNKFLAGEAKRLGFTYQTIDKIIYNYHEVSSSNIKKLMQLGAFGIINQILARPYSIEGKVVSGSKRATLLGFPTANIVLEQDAFLPLFGVYLIKVNIGKKQFFGVANIGIRPTFSNSNPLLEVHLFDFTEELYDIQLKVHFLHFIRPERKFQDASQLQEQIKNDIIGAQFILKHIKNF